MPPAASAPAAPVPSASAPSPTPVVTPMPGLPIVQPVGFAAAGCGGAASSAILPLRLCGLASCAMLALSDLDGAEVDVAGCPASSDICSDRFTGKSPFARARQPCAPSRICQVVG